jgi:hypothetical protein
MDGEKTEVEQKSPQNEEIEPDNETFLKPKKTRAISEELRKKRSEHMKAVNQARIEKNKDAKAEKTITKLSNQEKKAAQVLEKVKVEKSKILGKDLEPVAPPKTEAKPKKKKIIKIVNEPESGAEDESDEEIVIVNRVQKPKPKIPAQPKAPARPEILCKFV